MSVSAIVPEKSRGNKKCDEETEEKNDTFLAVLYRFKISVTWWYATLLIIYVHIVEDSTLMSIFDQFCFCFVFLGLPKIGPNRYT